MITTARSVTWFVDKLLRGPIRSGVGLGHGHVKFGPYVVTITPPGSPRMPNGIECEVDIKAGDSALLGDGALRTRDVEVVGGAIWQARPDPRVSLDARPSIAPDPRILLGAGAGLTPEGDDVLVGYLAGRALFEPPPDFGLITHVRRRTSALSWTLLFHAVRGELPEPAHALLEASDPDPLLSFGHSSGRAIILGLALAGRGPETSVAPTRVMIIDGSAHWPRTIVRVFPLPGAISPAA